MTQESEVLKYIRCNGSITSMEAFRKLNITRLAARISDLRRHGHFIKTETVKKNGKYFAKYTEVKK